MSECKCDFRTYMVGDGCEVCNPAKALKYAKETIADQNDEIDTLRAHLAASEARAERYRWLREHFRFANDSMRELWFDPALEPNDSSVPVD